MVMGWSIQFHAGNIILWELLASGDCWTSWIQVFVVVLLNVGVSLYVCIVHVHCIDFL